RSDGRSRNIRPLHRAPMDRAQTESGARLRGDPRAGIRRRESLGGAKSCLPDCQPARRNLVRPQRPSRRKLEGRCTRESTLTANTIYDRVILGGHVIDPESNLDAVRNIGLLDGRIAAITTDDLRGRDTLD